MEKRIAGSKEGRHVLQYYVAKQNSILTRMSGECDKNLNTLRLGMLVEALEDLGDSALRVRVNDTTGSEIWRGTEWRCHRYDLIPVSSEVWKFLPAVSVPQERVHLANHKLLCKELTSLMMDDTIWYCPDPQGYTKYLAVIKYIGPVPELGQGYYFGLDLLDGQESSKTALLSKEYFVSKHSEGRFATLSNIFPLKPEGPTGLGNSDKNVFLKTDSGNNYTNEKKKSVLDSTPPVLLEKFAIFDDNKNNNRDQRPLSNEYLQSPKSMTLENDSNVTKNTNIHVYAQSGSTSEKNENKKCGRVENTELIVGSNVKILLDSDVHYGVIRWIGTPPGITPGKLIAAVELDDGHPSGTDGTYKDVRYFHCRPYRAVFIDLDQCSRYDTMVTMSQKKENVDDPSTPINTDNFGNMESSVIVGMVRPISVKGNLKNICGKYRGIQGHHNSCYLDATLFSMFTFTSVFDNLLFRPPNEKDCPQYEEVQRVLREEIVNPLRKNMFVRADHVMKLRTLLEKLSSVSGLTSEEKDPEEFLTSLVAQILNAEPFLKLSSGQDAYHYQLFVEKDDHLNLPTVQQLLEQSFLTSNIRLKEVPSCLIIQMPRFGKSFKMYQKIQPTLLLDVTDIIEDSPRQCTICGKLAEFECKECYGQCGVGLESIAFCLQCLEKVHRHERRTNHEPKKLVVPMEFAILQEHCPVPRLYLELSAVVCIETSHYVCFVKCGSGSEAPWCFFDSMADRKGEQNGYNIPEMVPCPGFPYWLSEEGGHYLTELTDDRHLPEHAKRLLCDAYMCMYQSPDVMMYK
ncbi:ubiquitin carboxyl-terminal hydrolase CYLD [Hylaeus anthracinus]|uniref:ubiquitin carboxyl-terminal hydrolase CYLD n=1 Tax=Hylaeus volcanicus TaxID=313075 RepID=UPI0023B7C2E8|nr:ubiquitin carboxyl-terminal hydrolase CYLD [Hylaeus volcanicus]XP_053999145.1 ubiquitin carboxyl-terminal hydrolase CYLD [Hylaeus anthracinus]XP_053999146.1 ubiquitin carboxyl-terminal hydrolase CYLD [Hylaeus anthracinus]